MKIELDEKDILSEIDDNFRNDVDFLYRVVDEGTTNYESFVDVAIKMVKLLQSDNYLDRFLEETDLRTK